MPLRNAAQYLEDALSSFLIADGLQAVELIIVDDHSTDDSRLIIDHFIEQHQLPAIILDGTGEGPGLARNLGISHARGAYLVFLDADDIIDMERVIGLCQQMQTLSCDLAIYNHCRLYPSGELRANKKGYLLESSDGKLFSGSEKNFLLENFNVAWNKIYSTNLVESYKLTFPAGIYEDIPWSIGCLAAAEKVMTDERIMYTYRQHRKSTLKLKGPQHLVLLDQYQFILNFLYHHSSHIDFIQEVKQRAIQHAFLIAFERSRMKRKLRGQSFSRILRFIAKNSCWRETLKNNKLTYSERLCLFFHNDFLLEYPKIKEKIKKRLKKP
ncbi:MAG: glycosyltransferase [Tetragenococcus koreensis]|nr:glycosyltransferase [Tetragenococcus koreensis]